ncbi:unnamed protein product [Paramecium sonneborni]|uniref:ubiquitinyl hydrolase 1 n=1 Tax=Paramecium sonneborni TaxID=65129 RepID=A0A8S1M9I7_9CILI|nr:unnamed protein product [Paramecium sonneborni]
MGSGAGKSLTIPVVYAESQNNNHLANFKTTNKQKFTITDPYSKLQQGYLTIPLIVRKVDDKEPIKVVHGVVGLKNLGNTCYFNSAIHCLSHTQPLLDYMLSRVFEKEINRNSKLGSRGQVTECFAQLLSDIWKDERSIGMSSINQMSLSMDMQKKQKLYENWVDPLRLLTLVQKYSKRFEIGQQEDCQELLSYLLDMIHEDLNRCKKKESITEKDYIGEPKEEWAAESWGEHLKINKSIVVDLFQGQLKSKVECKTCKYQSHKWEPFLFLNLPIKQSQSEQSQKLNQSKVMGNSQLKQDNQCSLTDCLDQFQQEETIQWKCPQCKVTRDCKKGIRIWKLPNILIIHLKRFEFGTKVLGKITSKVIFPLKDLNMSTYCFDQGNMIYNLYAVAQHHGSLQYGHYVSICQHRVDNQWYMYNDDAVLKIQNPEKMIVNEYAYVLFYQKQTESIYRQTITDPSYWPHNQSDKKQTQGVPLKDESKQQTLTLMDYEETEQKGQLDDTSPQNISRNSIKLESQDFSQMESLNFNRLESQNGKKKNVPNPIIREQNNKSNSIYKRSRPSDDNYSNSDQQTSIPIIREQNNKSNSIYKRSRPSNDNQSDNYQQISITKLQEEWGFLPDSNTQKQMDKKVEKKFVEMRAKNTRK